MAREIIFKIIEIELTADCAVSYESEENKNE